MSDVLNNLKRASVAPIFVDLSLSEFNPEDTRSTKVRVNPSRKMWREYNEAQERGDNEFVVTFIGELLGLNAEVSKDLFIGDDDTDPTFGNWLARRVMELVGGHIERNFLAPKTK